MKKSFLIEQLHPVWLSCQTDLHEVIRWEKFLVNNPKMRRQSTMSHVVSVSLVVSIALLHLKKYTPHLDDALIQRAFTLHDLPEGFSLRKCDTSAVDKTANDDLKEYALFVKNFSHLPTDIYFELKKAYLLQYAEENSEVFPKEARIIMDDLWSEKCHEARVFLALQCWEYLFYAVECEKAGTNKEILVHVLRNQLPVLQKYSKLIPGFREEIFTEDFENYVLNYLRVHRHI